MTNGEECITNTSTYVLKITCRLRLALDYQRFRTDEVQTIQHEYKDVCGLLFKHVFQHDANGIYNINLFPRLINT